MNGPDPDYPVEALSLLLDARCLPERYYPLLPYKEALILGLRARGIAKKSGAEGLPAEAFSDMGLSDGETVALLRRFLSLYDPRPAKLRELDGMAGDSPPLEAYRELYLLPGVKRTRAELYYRSGYRCLRQLAESTAEELRERAGRTITEKGMSCTVPLPKEARTHIAVARAFCGRV